jgi:hypothetical protein
MNYAFVDLLQCKYLLNIRIALYKIFYKSCADEKGFQENSLETLYCLAPPARLERATL